MFALTFLGTSASVPSAERNHPGLLVEAGSHRILVDCGEGTQRHVQAITVAIDQYAEKALGNREYFLNKPYSIGSTRNKDAS